MDVLLDLIRVTGPWTPGEIAALLTLAMAVALWWLTQPRRGGAHAAPTDSACKTVVGREKVTPFRSTAAAHMGTQPSPVGRDGRPRPAVNPWLVDEVVGTDQVTRDERVRNFRLH